MDSSVECATVLKNNHFHDYFLALLKANPTYQVHIVTYLIQFPRQGTVLYDIFNELNKRPSYILVGTTTYVNDRQLNREIALIKKHWPRIKIEKTYNDHRKIYLLTYHTYNGAVLSGRKYRCWLSTLNLCETRSKNATVEVFGEQLEALRTSL
jgi:hypothetical protein